MNTPNPIMSLDKLLEAIEQFFDCRLTDAQEEELRKQIALTSFSHPAIDEAKAVMGFRKVVNTGKESNAHKEITIPSKRIDRRGFMAGLSVAASVALIITLGIMLLKPMDSVSSQCVAYVNGQRVTDEEIVLALMAENTHEFNEAADEAQQSLINELEFIAPVVDKYESNINPMEI